MKIFMGIFILIMASPSFAFVCGDVNNSGGLNLLDVSYIINHLYRGGPEFDCGLGTDECGDVNADDKVNLLDIAYIINFLYRGGPDPFCGTLTDIDDNTYQAIKIGNQWWMAENLKVTHYRNGDAIPNITNNTDWNALSTGAYCEYNDDINNLGTYGRLYNWFAVNDSRNIAPAGWHVPSDAEWKQLEMYLGMSQTEADATGTRGIDVGGKLKEIGTTHWLDPNTGATNESGFTGLPGGYRYGNGYYGGIGRYVYYWSATEGYDGGIWDRGLSYNISGVGRYSDIKQNGNPVRCVKD
jgi:uncharacterized protein (TIGR02145 family)